MGVGAAWYGDTYLGVNKYRWYLKTWDGIKLPKWNMWSTDGPELSSREQQHLKVKQGRWLEGRKTPRECGFKETKAIV